MQLDIELSNGEKTTLSESQYPFYARVLHRHDVDGASQLEIEGGYKPYPEQPAAPIGIPSVVKLHTEKPFAYFTREWQMYSFALLQRRVRESNPYATDAAVTKVAKRLFHTAYKSDRFQSNRNGTDRNRDYINDENAGAEDVRLEPVITAGNIVQITGAARVIGGVLRYPVLTFDVSEKPPQANVINYGNCPQRVFLGTIETRIIKGDNKRDRVIRSFEFLNGVVGTSIRAMLTRFFPLFDNTFGMSLSTTRIPFFLLTNGAAWIQADRIRRVDSVLGNNVFD